MKPSALLKNLPHLLAEGKPIFVWGKSGIGKSAVIQQFAQAANLQLRDQRASQLSELDFRGLPYPDVATKTTVWLTPEFLPTENDPPGILFLDELNGAKPAVASALYQLILDGRLGSYVFPKHWFIIAAGNTVDARGVTHQMPAPLNNRFNHIDFTLDADDWHKKAMDDGISRDIRSYLRLKSQSLHIFDPAVNPRSFPTPRSWYAADKIYKNPAYSPLDKLELLEGTIGEGTAKEFIGFCRDIAQMPDLDSIMMNPTKAKLPGTPAIMHAVVTTLVDDKVTVANMDRVMQYVTRLPREVQVVFTRGAVHKDEAITSCASYQDWAVKNQDIIL